MFAKASNLNPASKWSQIKLFHDSEILPIFIREKLACFRIHALPCVLDWTQNNDEWRVFFLCVCYSVHIKVRQFKSSMISFLPKALYSTKGHRYKGDVVGIGICSKLDLQKWISVTRFVKHRASMQNNASFEQMNCGNK